MYAHCFLRCLPFFASMFHITTIISFSVLIRFSKSFRMQIRKLTHPHSTHRWSSERRRGFWDINGNWRSSSDRRCRRLAINTAGWKRGSGAFRQASLLSLAAATAAAAANAA